MEDIEYYFIIIAIFLILTLGMGTYSIMTIRDLQIRCEMLEDRTNNLEYQLLACLGEQVYFK